MADVLDIENQDEFEFDEDGDRKSLTNKRDIVRVQSVVILLSYTCLQSNKFSWYCFTIW